MQGKHGVCTHFISAYCPVYSRDATLGSVYAQQRCWLWHKHKIKESPQKVFIWDLCQLIVAYHQKDEWIVLFINANENICQSPSWMHYGTLIYTRQ